MLRHFAIVTALFLAAPLSAKAQTLSDALSACESFVVTGVIPDTVDKEFTILGDFDYATMETEVGTVLFTFANEFGLNSVTYCDLTGADPRDETGPIHVSWSKALPLVDAWMARRAAEGGGKAMPVLGNQRMFAACRDDAEYFVTADLFNAGARTENLPEDDWPLVVRINEWSGNAAKPCDF